MVMHACNCGTWEATAGLTAKGQYQPGLYNQFQTSLSYIARPCFKTNKMNKWKKAYMDITGCTVNMGPAQARNPSRLMS